MIWLAVASLSWSCDEPADSTQLTAAVNEAEGAFTGLDIAAFKEATDRIQTLLPCMVDPIPSNVAAEVHRFLGIRAVGDRDEVQAEQMFAAARMIEPEYEFPVGLIPEGNPVRDAYSRLSLDQPLWQYVPPPADGGYFHFDGQVAGMRSRAWHALAQRFDGTGRVVDTQYLAPSDPLPQYAVLVDNPDLDSLEGDLAKPTPTALVLAIVATGLTTGVLYGAAGLTEARFKNPNTPDDQLDPLARRTNALVIASGVGSAATVGLGVGLIAVRW